MKQADKNRLLLDWRTGKISPENRRKLELAALQDDFLFDAIEGIHFEEKKGKNIDDGNIDALRQKLENRVNRPAKRRKLWIPAAAASIILIGGMWWFLEGSIGKIGTSSEMAVLEKTDDAPLEETDSNAELSEGASDMSQEEIESTIVTNPIPANSSRNSEKKTAPTSGNTKELIEEYIAQKPIVSSSKKMSLPPSEPTKDAFESVDSDVSDDVSMDEVVVLSAPEIEEESPALDEGYNATSTQSSPQSNVDMSRAKNETNAADSKSIIVVDGVREGAAKPNAYYASPEKGFDAFYRYINNNKKLSDDAAKNRIIGDVVLEFEIDKNGKPKNFKVISSPGYGLDSLAIKLVADYPEKWSAGKASVVVKF